MNIATALARILTASALIAVAGLASAQPAYPSKPIRFIVPFPPGGSTDPMARMSAGKLAEKWGQAVVVENRPGGNTIIGTEAVAKAAPDGYTILLISFSFVTGPSLLPYLPYSPVTSFDPMATIAKSRYVLTLHPSVPANNLQEFIALVRAKPGQLNYGSSGVGTGVHMAGALFNNMMGTKIQHVPYKGSGPLIADLIGGQVELSFQIPVSTIGHIKAGRLKAIAITGDKRLPTLPQVPTFAEAGLPEYFMQGWYGIVSPAGTPKAIINKMSHEMAAILVLPDILEYLARQGMEPFISTPDEMAALIKSDIAKYAKVIKDADIKLQQ
ncbi:MAG: tripartite tricarboxylate transporter substrate binding protein [Pseudomonadota bacterium]